ncbi:hypothetical protein GXW83_13615 [Streptacidiphilus sp. PB12-B1b]|uniref:tetratricopeptide repeat protein n=1 Tax=Streptacidiphilus sp. PB12-B1b TaxID=2705012 RepID=UPI0015FE2290|nr:hypothetical protein [Streptacidiphilus sp. PB12-B1b]QMU76626.1 hypothetical protein GXW83_13615 [Streptacidiphilus sp. PB12-B1b]
MSILGRRSSSPRLLPELDDIKLGKTCKQVAMPSIPGQLDIRVDLLEKVIRECGSDWDRRGHRMVQLARAADASIARDWLRRRPHDPDAQLFSAWAQLVRGRWDGALADPQAALDCCRRAADLAPADPGPWVVLLGVMRLQRRPHADAFSVWREITARDRWNREAHLQMLGYLSPEECGSYSHVLQFLDAVLPAMPADAPCVGIELTAMVENFHRSLSVGGVVALGAGRHWTRRSETAALERGLTSWSQPDFLTHAAALADLNLLAYALTRAELVPQSAAVFRTIGTVVTPWPWGLDGDPLEEFSHAQSRALRAAPAQPRR